MVVSVGRRCERVLCVVGHSFSPGPVFLRRARVALAVATAAVYYES